MNWFITTLKVYSIQMDKLWLEIKYDIIEKLNIEW